MVQPETIAERAVCSGAAEVIISRCSPEWCMSASQATHMGNEINILAWWQSIFWNVSLFTIEIKEDFN